MNVAPLTLNWYWDEKFSMMRGRLSNKKVINR